MKVHFDCTVGSLTQWTFQVKNLVISCQIRFHPQERCVIRAKIPPLGLHSLTLLARERPLIEKRLPLQLPLLCPQQLCLIIQLPHFHGLCWHLDMTPIEMVAIAHENPSSAHVPEHALLHIVIFAALSVHQGFQRDPFLPVTEVMKQFDELRT